MIAWGGRSVAARLGGCIGHGYGRLPKHDNRIGTQEPGGESGPTSPRIDDDDDKLGEVANRVCFDRAASFEALMPAHPLRGGGLMPPRPLLLSSSPSCLPKAWWTCGLRQAGRNTLHPRRTPACLPAMPSFSRGSFPRSHIRRDVAG